MAEHTKGPWFVAANSAECVVFHDGDRVATRVNFIDCNTAANARLIAAAPDLLEAMDLALEYFNSAQVQLSASGQVARDAARAAIQKAKG